MRGINSRAVYARKIKTTLTLKVGSEVSSRVKKRKMLCIRGFFNEAIDLRQAELKKGVGGVRAENNGKTGRIL